jgi:hypothetical protein
MPEFADGGMAKGGVVLTSQNIEREFEKNPKKFKDKYIVYSELGEDFQEYVFENGKKVSN